MRSWAAIAQAAKSSTIFFTDFAELGKCCACRWPAATAPRAVVFERCVRRDDVVVPPRSVTLRFQRLGISVDGSRGGVHCSDVGTLLLTPACVSSCSQGGSPNLGSVAAPCIFRGGADVSACWPDKCSANCSISHARHLADFLRHREHRTNRCLSPSVSVSGSVVGFLHHFSVRSQRRSA